MSANSTFSAELKLMGKIIANDIVCDCGHRAGAHVQFEAECSDINEETGQPCRCPFHSLLDPFHWDRTMSEIRTIERLNGRIATLLDKPAAEIYWDVVNSTSSHEYSSKWIQAILVSQDLAAAFELRSEGLERIMERFCGM